MKDLSSDKQKNDVQMHIENGWKIIDAYLPVTYVDKVIEINPSLRGSEIKIRNVRRKLQKPEYQMDIFTALLQVALKNKEAIERLSNINIPA